MTVKQWIDFLSTLDPDKNLCIIYDGSNRPGLCYSNGEYDLSDLQIMCPQLAKYINDFWSELRYTSGDYCILVP